MKDSKFDIAILLATRGRGENMLGRSVKALVERAKDISRVQFFFAFDNDDSVGTGYFTQELQPWMDARDLWYRAIRFQPMGYVNLHKYNNHMASQADANWLIIYNDDAVMETDGWDEIIANYHGQFKLLSFHSHRDHPYSIFPIVPRAWFDLLGYISPHPTQDGWVSQQAYMLDIFERIPVWVLHDRFDITGNNDDDTFRKRPMLEGKPTDPNDFHSMQQSDIRHRDSARLATHMRQLGLSTEFFENIFKGTQDPWEKLIINDTNRQMVQFANPVNPHFQQSRLNSDPLTAVDKPADKSTWSSDYSQYEKVSDATAADSVNTR